MVTLDRGGAAVACLLMPVACNRGENGSQRDLQEPAASVASVATASSAPPAADPPEYAERKIQAGWFEKELWTESFSIGRRAGGAGGDHLAALETCSATGRALCTDAQWARACEADPALGTLQTWTASGVGGDRWVVRGGSGCDARTLEGGKASAPARVAVCCDRAVAIRTGNRNLSFVKATADQLSKYERALRQRDYFGLESLYEESVGFGGVEYPRAKLIQRHKWDFGAYPKQWILFDECDASIVQQRGDAFLQCDCRTAFNRAGRTLVAMQRFVWGGPERRLGQVGPAVTERVAGSRVEYHGEPEQKERVGVLLLAD